MEKIKILILEDNESDIDLVMYELQKLKAKIEITVTKNKNEFNDALNKNEPDIVLSDYNLPDIDGTESLSVIRNISQDIPYILVSATIGEEKAVELMRNGASDFIMKDNLKKLIPTIEREIKGYESKKSARADHAELVKLTTAVNQSPSIIVMTNVKGDVEYVNPRFSEVTGYSMEDVKNKNPRILKSGEMTEEEYSEMWDTITGGKIWKGEFLNRKKNGELYWEGATVGPVFDDRKQISNFLKLSQDITDKKQLVKELLKEKEALTASNRELEQFAYIASHDLQEPLRMVSGFTDLLMKKYSDKLNDEARSYMNFAINGAKRMQSQIQGLLTYSRVSTRSNPFEKISLSEVLKEALMNLSVSVKESGARIESAELPVVCGDRYQLVSVFQNLIGNSIKFRKEDVIPKINILVKDTGSSDKIEISISDNGIGILEKDLDKIFLIFQRLHSQDKYPGTGIGLAVVKKIIEKHGGEIHVDSVLNEGTKFIFSLIKGPL